MDWTERRTRFRALIEGDRCVHPGSVFDAMSARIAEDLGFEIGMFAGSTASLAVLGAGSYRSHVVLIRGPSLSLLSRRQSGNLGGCGPWIWQRVECYADS